MKSIVKIFLAFVFLFNEVFFNQATGKTNPLAQQTASTSTTVSTPTPSSAFGAYPPPDYPTETPTPSSPPTPVLPPNIPTPTPTVTTTPPPPVVPAEKNLELKISAEPAIYIPGKPIFLHLNVDGFAKSSVTSNMQVVLHIPDGVTPSDKTISAAITPDRLLKILPDSVDKSISWDVASTAKLPFVFSVELLDNGKQLEVNAVVIDAGRFEVEKGKSISTGISAGNVSLSIPDDSIDESLVIDIRNPSPNKLPSVSLTGRPVEIIASGKTSGKNVSHFKEPITLQMQYAPEQHLNWPEESMTIFYYNENDNDWYPLQTEVDINTKTLSAEIDHLTVFDYKAVSWQSNSVPTVDSFKVNDFTGAGTYSMDFWRPSGPGGIMPNLSLSYNSQIIDESTAYTQASWVGMGWSLETGSITRNMHGTNADLTDDTFVISMNGISGLLLPIGERTEGSSTYRIYNLSDQSFVKVEALMGSDQEPVSWTVFGKDGTVYEFNWTTTTIKSDSCDGGSTTLNLIWQWSLTSVKNIFYSPTNDTSISYTYTNGTKNLTCGNNTASVQIAVYPSSIMYGKNKILFDLQDRTDYQQSWTTVEAETLYETKRLEKMRIQSYVNGAWINVRQYQFTYAADNGDEFIYPGVKWTPQTNVIGRTLTLIKVQEWSGDGNSSLPATNFFYGDEYGDQNGQPVLLTRVHLTKVDNNQGGSVEFKYETSYHYDDANKKLRAMITIFGYDECNPYSRSGSTWYPYESNSYIFGCLYGAYPNEADNSYLQVGPVPQGYPPAGPVALHSFPQEILKPGGLIKFYVQGMRYSNDTGVNYGFRDLTDLQNQPDNSRYIPAFNFTQYLTEHEGDIIFPTSFHPDKTVLWMACSACIIKKFEVSLYISYAQVVEKKITDAITNKISTITYQYDGSSTNTATVSESVKAVNSDPAQLYTPSMGEYRGHSMTQITNPDGSTTMEWFYQNDALKGRSYHSLVMGQDIYDGFDQSLGSAWVKSPSGISDMEKSWGLDFDYAVSANGNNTDWNVSLSRSAYSLTNGKTAIAHLRLSSSTTQAISGLWSDNNQFFGLVTNHGNNGNINLCTGLDTNGQDCASASIGQTLISNFQPNEWYAVMLTVDNSNGFRIRIWQVGAPEISNEITTSGYTPANWKYREQVKSGVLWLDTFSEGSLQVESETSYETTVQFDTDPTTSAPDLLNNMYSADRDLKVVWVHPTQTISRTYGNGIKWIGNRQTYAYAPVEQFGNLIHTIYEEWNGSDWIIDHATGVEFFPRNDAIKYLVNLPARQIEIQCSSSCDFSGATGLLAETLYIYDSNSVYNLQPNENGRLTKKRTLADIPSGQKRYSEVGYSYDGYGNITGVTTYKRYATASASPAETGSTTTKIYDETYHSYLTSETNPLSQSVTTDYDYSLGLPIKVTDPNGAMEGAAYDAFGRMIAVCEPGDWDGTTCNQTTGTTLSITYIDYQANPKVPFNILLKQKLDATRFMQSTRYYSGLGELLQTQSLGVQLSDGVQNTVVDYQYDTLGRLKKQTRPYAYSGSPAFQTQTFTLLQGTTTTDYDILGRVTGVTQADGATEARTYSLVNDAELGWGLQTAITDANNNTTSQLNDAWGRLVRVTPAIGPGVKYTYDLLGQLTDAYYGSAHTQLAYNNAGQKTSMDDPDLGAWYYGYDYAGNLTTQTDAKHQRTCMYYDELNRLIGKNYQDDSSYCPTGSPSSFTVSYSYDSTAAGPGKGRRTGMIDPTGSTTWVFDARGRVVSENKIFQDGAVILGNYATSWTYNSADQIVDMTYPSGEIISTTYLDQGLINTVGDYVTSIKYDASGRIRERNLGNGTKTDLHYNDWNVQGGRLETLRSGTIDSFNETFTDLQDLTFDYDSVGNIQSILDKWRSAEKTGDQRQCFTYDDLNRLTRATTRADSLHDCTNPTDSLPGNYDDSYTYNSATGNLASKTGIGAYGYTDLEHPHALNELNGIEKYTYDANGNIESRVASSDTYKMDYDAENRLISVTKVVGETEEKIADYAYDGDGNRVIAKDYTVSQTSPDKTLYFGNYFEVFIDADYQPSGGEWEAPDCGVGRYCVFLPMVFGPPPLPGQVWKSYYYAGDVRVAMQIVDHAGGTSGVYYLYSDQLGSTAVTANSDGSWRSTINYKAWGETRWNSGTTQTTFLFTGQRLEKSLGGEPSYDGTDGLYFFNSRWYDPALGRFVQPDTIVPDLQGVQAFNRYTYTNNNPLRYTDPSGHCFIVCAIVGGVVGAIIGAAAVAVPQMIKNAQEGKPLTANIDPAEVGKHALMGAAFGAVIGGTMGAAAAAFAPTAATTMTEVAIAGGGAAKVIDTACGGDMCASEVQDISRAAQTVLPAAENAISQTVTSINSGANVVYQFIENGVAKYYGITNNFARRAAEHFGIRGWTIEPMEGLESLSRFDARAVEQVLIKQAGLLNLYNKINSIAVSNPIYDEAVRRGTEILKIVGYLSN